MKNKILVILLLIPLLCRAQDTIVFQKIKNADRTFSFRLNKDPMVLKLWGKRPLAAIIYGYRDSVLLVRVPSREMTDEQRSKCLALEQGYKTNKEKIKTYNDLIFSKSIEIKTKDIKLIKVSKTKSPEMRRRAIATTVCSFALIAGCAYVGVSSLRLPENYELKTGRVGILLGCLIGAEVLNFSTIQRIRFGKWKVKEIRER